VECSVGRDYGKKRGNSPTIIHTRGNLLIEGEVPKKIKCQSQENGIPAVKSGAGACIGWWVHNSQCSMVALSCGVINTSAVQEVWCKCQKGPMHRRHEVVQWVVS